MNKLNNITDKIFEKISNITNTDTDKLLENLAKEIITTEESSKYIEKYIKCTQDKHLKLSHRKLLYYDIIKKLNPNISSIINILPYFWFKNIQLTEKFSMTISYELYLCKLLNHVNIIIDDSDHKSDKYNKSFSANSLGNYKLKCKYDFIHAELFKDLNKKNYLMINDYLIGLCNFIYNNLNENGSVLIHIQSFNKDICVFIKNLIDNNIFTNYNIFHVDNISVFSLKSHDYYIYLTNYTNKQIDTSDLYKKCNIDDIEQIIKNKDDSTYDKLLYMYYQITDINNKDDMIIFIKNDMVNYCNLIGIHIDSEYTINNKYNIWNTYFNHIKKNILNILYIGSKHNIFYKYIYDNLMNNKSSNLYKKNIKNIYYNIIYFENDYDIISDIFLQLLDFFRQLDKNGIFIINNYNNNILNYNDAFSTFKKLFGHTFIILDQSIDIIIKKL